MMKTITPLFFILITAVQSLSNTFVLLQVNPQLLFSNSSSFLDGSNNYLSYGKYSDQTEHTSNFGQLYVKTNEKYSDEEQGYYAGFVEGYMTAERIYQHSFNMMCQVACDGSVPVEVEKFFKDQDIWIRSQVATLGAVDDMWKFVGTLINQMDGLIAGYAASDFGKKNKMTLWQFTMINAMGDLFDIIPAIVRSKRPHFEKMSIKQIRRYMSRTGHCSALIKATDDLSDIFVGHSSWFTYSSMLRIYKTYEFGLSNKSKRSSTISFSSYPGTLSSLDDLYIMGESKMIMTQTTNNIFNTTLWDQIIPQSLLAWHRVRSANQLANSGPEWFQIVSRYNSGTYNNQYMILDAKLFIPKNGLQDNTLFVMEQIPGLMVGKDVTKELERGYWSSFNVPYHHEIYEKSGYCDVDKRTNSLPYTEYQMAARSEIFRRDQSLVKDIETLQTVMRSNKFQTDPLSEKDPWNAICSRGDLDEEHPYAEGGYDTKVTSISMLTSSDNKMSMGIKIINGPTSQDQAPFVWSTSGLSDRHVGQPDRFEFEFEYVSYDLMTAA